jgi:hypothetical protein
LSPPPTLQLPGLRRQYAYSSWLLTLFDCVCLVCSWFLFPSSCGRSACCACVCAPVFLACPAFLGACVFVCYLVLSVSLCFLKLLCALLCCCRIFSLCSAVSCLRYVGCSFAFLCTGFVLGFSLHAPLGCILLIFLMNGRAPAFSFP